MSSVGIVGAGILGRLLALRLACDQQVTLLDAGPRDGRDSCSFSAAGMLAPYSELESAEPAITRLGVESLRLWPKILAALETPVFFQKHGSLVLAHPRDRAELGRLRRRVEAVAPEALTVLDADARAALEPELPATFNEALYFAEEGQIDPRAVLAALAQALPQRGVSWEAPVTVDSVQPGAVHAGGRCWKFDWVIDCRGLGARHRLAELRGVRGEWLLLESDEITLGRPVRVMHPRYPLYVVPRPRGLFLVGATVIESDDRRPISVRAVLELLSAAYSLHPAFATATLIESGTQCRPAFPDQLPHVRWQRGLLEVNGLYRHGFLIGPRLVEMVAEFLSRSSVEAGAAPYFEEVA